MTGILSGKTELVGSNEIRTNENSVYNPFSR